MSWIEAARKICDKSQAKAARLVSFIHLGYLCQCWELKGVGIQVEGHPLPTVTLIKRTGQRQHFQSGLDRVPHWLLCRLPQSTAEQPVELLRWCYAAG